MPVPVLAPGEVDVGRTDSLLAGWAVGYRNAGYKIDRLIPQALVGVPSDTYPVFGMEAFRARDLRADGRSHIAEVGLTMSTSQYTTGGHAVKSFVGDDEDVRLPAFDRRTQGTRLVMDSLLLEREVLGINFVTDAANYPSALVDTTAHAIDGADVKLLPWLNGRKTVVRRLIGASPNVLACGLDVWETLVTHPNLLARLGASERGTLTRADVEGLLELDEVIVFDTLQDSAAEGQDPVLTEAWPAETAVLAYRGGLSADTYGRVVVERAEPSAFKMPTWTQVAGGVEGVRIRRWRDEGRGSGGGEYIGGAMWYGFIRPAANASLLMTNLLS